MTKEYSNNDVFDSLAEECRCHPELWEEFGKGILSHTNDVDFWVALSEHIDCFRVCDECGKPMIVGYMVDGCDTYCSDECLHKHLNEEEFKELYNDGETYWITWYEDLVTYKGHK